VLAWREHIRLLLFEELDEIYVPAGTAQEIRMASWKVKGPLNIPVWPFCWRHEHAAPVEVAF
jgi:hypothetical protein